ncbi:MAG TPA: hypothetical protein VGM39_06040, partial [Kofleriaceae bacterium]
MKRAALLVAALGSVAHAAPKLKLDHEPPPRNLKMRPRVAQQPLPKKSPIPSAPAATPVIPSNALPPGEDSATAALRDANQRVAFSLDLGYQLDSASLSGDASLDRPAPTKDNPKFDSFRAYGFGELIGATRGVGTSSLSTYFAVRFQALNQSNANVINPATGETERSKYAPPIATWFEKSGVEIRHGWGELKDFLPKRWGLSRLRVRAGEQYVYGPWVMHLDGLLVSYDGPILTLSAYTGLRHEDYVRSQSADRPAIGGASVRFDLRGLKNALPLALQAELLSIGDSDNAMQPATSSALFQGDWRPRRDVAMIASVRTLDGNVASQRLEVRARYKEVTNVVVDLNRHTADDWRWDPTVLVGVDDPTAARRYLDLGPVVPRFVGSLRAGTLIAENIDLLLRGAVAGNLSDDEDIKNTFLAPYWELGGAAEFRLRRTIAITTSALHRNTHHEVLEMPIVDHAGVPDPLVANEYRGEHTFTEVGAAAKLTLGARTFSTQVELYGRKTDYEKLYTDVLLDIPDHDIRYGGRITL